METGGNVAHVGKVLQQGHTKFDNDFRQIFVIEVAVGIICEILDVVYDAGVFLTGNNLQALYYNLVITYTLGSECVEPEVRCIEVARIYILTGSCAVDADGGGEGEEHVIARELLSVFC